jgi:hypothetical protein
MLCGFGDILICTHVMWWTLKEMAVIWMAVNGEEVLEEIESNDAGGGGGGDR